MPARYAIVEAASHLGLRAPGVARAPRVLLEHGLATAIDARLASRVPAPPSLPGVGPTGVLNANLIPGYSVALADAVGEVLDAGEFPLVLGGDCSILLGGALALRRRGRSGLLFLDAHADFYQPEAEPAGEAASMELALATGRGPVELTALEGKGPLVRDDDVVVVGRRDAELAAAEGSRPLDPAISRHDLAAIHANGAAGAATAALAHLERPDGAEGFWIHLDVDVLDDSLMPAVDYRIPGGLSWEQLCTLLVAALRSPRAVGMEVTIFNPDLDADGSVGARLVVELAQVLVQAR